MADPLTSTDTETDDSDPIVSFFRSLVTPSGGPASSRPDPIALSPFAGLVPPSKRPPAPKLDPAKAPSQYAGLAPPPPSNPLLRARETAKGAAQQRLAKTGLAPKDQLRQRGITEDQKAARVPFVSELLAQNVDSSLSYDSPERTAETLKDTALRMTGQRKPLPGGRETDDAWRMYLGLPQRAGTFTVSEYRPSKEKGDTAYYYSVNGMFDKYAKDQIDWWHYGETEKAVAYPKLATKADVVRSLVHDIDRNGGRFYDEAPVEAAMGNFSWSRGKDEKGDYIAYYDKWDLSPTVTPGKEFDVGKVIGKPFEIYDRVYYDPKTFEPIQPGQTQPHLAKNRDSRTEWPADLNAPDENDAMLVHRTDAQGKPLKFPVPERMSNLLPPHFVNARKTAWGTPLGKEIPGRPDADAQYGLSFDPRKEPVVEDPNHKGYRLSPNTVTVEPSVIDTPASATHEIGHAIYDRDLTKQQREEFDWIVEQAARSPNPPKAIARYAAEFPDDPYNRHHETFAELWGHYMANPTAFKAAYPGIYDTLKRFAGGYEYIGGKPTLVR